MDIVGGKSSCSETSRGDNYILTIIDCFTCYTIVIFLPDQSSFGIISAIINNLITVYSYGNPHSI